MIAQQLGRLAKHSAIYGLGAVVSRLIGVFLLPVVTRYLTRAELGAVDTLIALSIVLVIVFRAGISMAFFRYYFDAEDDAGRTRVVRTSFWYTMAAATTALVLGCLLAPQISEWLFSTHSHADLVRAAFVLLWAQMNYEQLTSLFRVEERSVAFVAATLANVLITVGSTILLVAVWDKGALGVLVGNFTGTLVVYFVLLAYRRYQLGLEFDRPLFRQMQRFGLPLVPSGLAIWAIDFADRFFLLKLKNAAEVGLYSVGVRISTAILLLLIALRTAWPAFAYSIKEDDEAKRTYAFVLTYVLFVSSWVALTLSLLAPWLVRLLTTRAFYGGARVVPLLVFGATAFIGFNVMSIGIGRAKATQFNWVVTGAAAVIAVGLNLILIPPYGMMGAAASTLVAYTVMFLGMTVRAQQVFPVPYQWRRLATVVGAAVALTVVGKWLDVPLGGALALCAVYPLVLLPLGFYLPVELRRIRAIVSPAR
ncbi:MAG TPA: oligosaccharide flippase family protein [Gaiellaceae bacterium]|nr:oligosaccharide flippase family protein [Gaiellaceae bacterium]